MNEYLVFWIKEEFAYHYFYKNDILHRFLSAYQANKERWDLSAQYEYITNEIPSKMLTSNLYRNYNHSIQAKKDEKEFEIYNDHQYVTLHIYEKKLEFLCETLSDAEELLFPSLRIFQPLLFVMSKTNYEEYGWISPVIKNRKFNSGQTLYSSH